MPSATADGLRIEYSDTGASGGLPLLLQRVRPLLPRVRPSRAHVAGIVKGHDRHHRPLGSPVRVDPDRRSVNGMPWSDVSHGDAAIEGW